MKSTAPFFSLFISEKILSSPLKDDPVNIPKISLFKKGSEKLDEVINKNPKFVESRWLRFCLQKNLE